MFVIEPYYDYIQDGLDYRLNLDKDEFKICPNILCIKIERVTADGLNNSQIEVNKSIELNIIGQDDKPCRATYKLNSFICHKNIIPKLDHFISVVLKDEKIYYCEDSKIKTGLPKNTS